MAIQSQLGPSQIDRKNQERIVKVSAEPEISLSEAVEAVNARLPEINRPQGFAIGFGAEVEQQEKTFNELRLVLILALILVYAVMASQYESLRDPFIIMFSVPTAAIGVVLALYLTNTSFNLQAYLGVIMLGGIVVSNAILLVDYTNILRRRDGMELREAVEVAGRTRLRPILMTSLATMLGLVPMALGIGEGSELQVPLARVVIGGLLTSTFITLVFVPTVYTLFEEGWSGLWKKHRPAGSSALVLSQKFHRGALNNVSAPKVLYIQMRKILLIVVVVAAIGAAGYGYYRYTQKPAAPTVTTARVTRGDIAETVGATGQLQAVTTVQVGTQVSGTILELNADFNSLVRKGQVLARLDPSLFQTQIEQARANLVRAEADMERLRVALDDARTKLARAQELVGKEADRADRARSGGSRRALGRSAAAIAAGRRHAVAGVAPTESGEPRAHGHRVADRRPRHLAQRRRRPDGRGEHVGADALRACRRSDEDAGARQPRRIRRRPHPPGADRAVPRRRLPHRRIHRAA